jgi:hypothetical protein
MAATFKLFKNLLFLKKDGWAVGSRLIIEKSLVRIPPPEPSLLFKDPIQVYCIKDNK